MEFEFSTDSSPSQREADFQLNVLASTIAHEIRNPLQAMRLQIESAKQGRNREQSLESLSRNLDRLERVVSRVQSLSQKYELKPVIVDFREIFESVLGSIRFWLEASGIRVSEHIRWEGPPTIEADRELLEQVLLNLLTNAIDSMPKGGELRIQVRECEFSAEIKIADTGCGMETECLKKVGTPFFTTKANGNGLGVAFCKSIISLHRGSIEFESKPEEGTSVRISLPKSRGDQSC